MKYVVFHGTKGSPQGNWFPWLQTRLPNVVVPQLPTPEGQSKDNWMTFVPPIDGDDVLIGHSCGATFLLHVLEDLKVPVKQSIFVSPVMGPIGIAEYDTLNKSFYDHVFDWKCIRANAGKTLILHGDNDPYVPLLHALELNNGLGGAMEIVPGGGHLNAESGYTAFPALLRAI